MSNNKRAYWMVIGAAVLASTALGYWVTPLCFLLVAATSVDMIISSFTGVGAIDLLLR